MKSGKSDEAANFIGFSLFGNHGIYSSANSAFLRLSNMAWRFPL